MNCIFCKIADKKIESHIVYEDKYSIVFLDANPDVNGHLLVAPKEHYADINDLPNGVYSHLNKVVKKMIELLEDKLNAEGVTVCYNYGCVPEVKHFHMHIIPRYKKDGVKHIYPKDKLVSLEEIKEKLT